MQRNNNNMEYFNFSANNNEAKIIEEAIRANPKVAAAIEKAIQKSPNTMLAIERAINSNPKAVDAIKVAINANPEVVKAIKNAINSNQMASEAIKNAINSDSYAIRSIENAINDAGTETLQMIQEAINADHKSSALLKSITQNTTAAGNGNSRTRHFAAEYVKNTAIKVDNANIIESSLESIIPAIHKA